MYIANITDYDNMTNHYNDTISINIICTNNDNNIEIVMSLITIKRCGMSLICLLALMVYTLIKHLIRKK